MKWRKKAAKVSFWGSFHLPALFGSLTPAATIKLEQRLLKLTKMGLNDSDIFCKAIQDKINRLPEYE